MAWKMLLQRRLRHVAEKAVERRYDLRALADRATHPFDRSRADIANGEHTWHRGFQRRHLPTLTLSRWLAGDDESAAIKHHAATLEPSGRGIGAREQEQVTDIKRALFTGQTAAPAHALERGIAIQPDHLGVEHQLDIGRGLDPLDQIARHAGPKTTAPDYHVDPAGVTRQEHRRLPGRITTADQDDFLFRANPRLKWSRPSTTRRGLQTGRGFRCRAAGSVL